MDPDASIQSQVDIDITFASFTEQEYETLDTARSFAAAVGGVGGGGCTPRTSGRTAEDHARSYAFCQHCQFLQSLVLGSHRLLERMHREFEEEFSFFLGSAHFLHRIDTGLEFNRLAREALDDVVTCFRVKDMTERQAGGGQAGGGDDFSDGD